MLLHIKCVVAYIISNTANESFKYRKRAMKMINRFIKKSDDIVPCSSLTCQKEIETLLGYGSIIPASIVGALI